MRFDRYIDNYLTTSIPSRLFFTDLKRIRVLNKMGKAHTQIIYEIRIKQGEYMSYIYALYFIEQKAVKIGKADDLLNRLSDLVATWGNIDPYRAKAGKLMSN